jgi:hypothetical protein
MAINCKDNPKNPLCPSRSATEFDAPVARGDRGLVEPPDWTGPDLQKFQKMYVPEAERQGNPTGADPPGDYKLAKGGAVKDPRASRRNYAKGGPVF